MTNKQVLVDLKKNSDDGVAEANMLLYSNPAAGGAKRRPRLGGPKGRPGREARRAERAGFYIRNRTQFLGQYLATSYKSQSAPKSRH